MKFHNALDAVLDNELPLYYQPPETIKMKYPCVVYSKQKPFKVHADDKAYLLKDCYEVMVIDRKIDSPYTEILLEGFQYADFDRHYVADNLHHDVMTIYF